MPHTHGRPSPSIASKTLLIVAVSLLFAVAAAGIGWHAWNTRADRSRAAQYRHRMEVLDDLRATGAISDAEYDQRAKALLVEPDPPPDPQK